MWNASPCPSLSVAIIWWHSGAVVNIINPAEEGLGVLMCRCVRFLPLIPPRVTKNMYQVDIHSRTMAAAGQMQQYIYVDMRYMCVHVTPTSCLPVLDRRVPAVQLSLRFILLSFVFLFLFSRLRFGGAASGENCKALQGNCIRTLGLHKTKFDLLTWLSPEDLFPCISHMRGQ